MRKGTQVREWLRDVKVSRVTKTARQHARLVGLILKLQVNRHRVSVSMAEHLLQRPYLNAVPHAVDGKTVPKCGGRCSSLSASDTCLG